MQRFFPKDRLTHLLDFYTVDIPDSWFLDALGVDSAFRRQGIGTRLIELTQESAIKNGYGTLSLIAFKDNAPALALYSAMGFRAATTIDLEGNAFIPHQDGCLLLTCELAT